VGEKRKILIIAPRQEFKSALLARSLVSFFNVLKSIFHISIVFMCTGMEISLHMVRYLLSYIGTPGGNTSSDQEINTTVCYIQWSRDSSVSKVIARRAEFRFLTRVGIFLFTVTSVTVLATHGAPYSIHTKDSYRRNEDNNQPFSYFSSTPHTKWLCDSHSLLSNGYR